MSAIQCIQTKSLLNHVKRIPSLLRWVNYTITSTPLIPTNVFHHEILLFFFRGADHCNDVITRPQRARLGLCSPLPRGLGLRRSERGGDSRCLATGHRRASAVVPTLTRRSQTSLTPLPGRGGKSRQCQTRPNVPDRVIGGAWQPQ